jgi:serine/threonine protein kinase
MITRIPREKAVFVEALEIADPEQRRQFLDQACGADQALREQVEKLLALSQSAGDFFKECAPVLEPVAADADQVLSAAESALEPEIPETKRIGPYKLLQQLGEGGYGVVYMADQEQPIRRRVALKIIKLGMDTKNVIARFEAERQALSLMDHPNIARVLDAGATETGRPYFVMELVYGVKITEYCDQNRVSMNERLKLFIQVCNAVQHAHQKGIIHRDLKPSNIMVTMHDGVPVPKVIDFGIAKATEQRLTDKTLFTSYAQLMGTPAYMSPEQMELSGLNLDTRSDIYSLGVLLYELLTGRTPFDTTDLLKVGVEELRRTVCEQEPLSPSAKLQTLNNDELTKTARSRHIEPPRLLSQLHGDLDWIVLKCLEKDRTRRYEGANALAMDIQRYLDEEAVLARPPSRLYRLQKLVRRNRALFAAGTGISLALAIGFGISTWLFFRERNARQEQYRLREIASRALENEGKLRLEAENRERITQAAFLISGDELEQADKVLNKVTTIEPSLEAEAVLRRLGEWHALRNEWEEAAARFEQLLQADQRDNSEMITFDLLMAGPIQIERGDIKGYEHFRRTAIAQFANTTDPTSAERTLKISLLLPANEDVMESLKPMNALAAESFQKDPVNAGTYPIMAAWRCISLALMAYRQNDMPTAKEWCRRCLSYQVAAPVQIATANILSAMASHQLGEAVEARVRLETGRKMIGAEFSAGLTAGKGGEGFWFDWLFARVLLREAEALIH